MWLGQRLMRQEESWQQQQKLLVEAEKERKQKFAPPSFPLFHTFIATNTQTGGGRPHPWRAAQTPRSHETRAGTLPASGAPD